MSVSRVKPQPADRDPVAATKELLNTVRERADEIETARRMPADLSDTFAEAGLYRLCVPRAYGGIEANPMTVLEVIETMATADGSAGWCVMIGTTSSVVAAYLAPETARLIYGDNPNTLTGGVFAPKGTAVPVDGGYQVEGRWQWGSGTQNADWVMGGCVVMRDGKPERTPAGVPNSRMVLVPQDTVRFHDTWHVAGLRGTGSVDFEIADTVVPAERTVALATDRPRVDGALYAFPVFGLLAMGVAGVGLGLAKAAIDEFHELAGSKTPQGSVRPLARKVQAQSDVSRAEAKRASARAYLYDAVAEAYDAATRTGEIPVEHRVALRLASTHAMTSSAEAVDLMYTGAGGTSVYETSRLQRIFRDVHVATQHMMVNAATLELTGRLILGVETDTSFL